MMPAQSGKDSIRGTIMLDQYSAMLGAQTGQAGSAQPLMPLPTGTARVGGPPAPIQTAPIQTAPVQAAAVQAPAADPHAIRGTMMLQSPFQQSQRGLAPVATAPQALAPQPYAPQSYSAPAQQAAPPVYASSSYAGAGPSFGGQRQAAVLPPQDSTEQVERLHYVCQRLRRARQPLCAINGVLTLLPMRLIQGGPREVDELQRAVRSDMQSLGRVLELRCPVTALVVGMEEEPGFRELVRRVGRERASVQRFGQRYDVRSLATAEEMSSLCAHVCGAFEDWVYTLFREQGALSRPGNTQLYALLCKVRLTVKHRLTGILAGAFGYDAHQAADSPVLFSGCYFAAIGSTEDRQAFAKGVFNKLLEEQEQIEWTPRDDAP